MKIKNHYDLNNISANNIIDSLESLNESFAKTGILFVKDLKDQPATKEFFQIPRPDTSRIEKVENWLPFTSDEKISL